MEEETGLGPLFFCFPGMTTPPAPASAAKGTPDNVTAFYTDTVPTAC